MESLEYSFVLTLLLYYIKIMNYMSLVQPRREEEKNVTSRRVRKNKQHKINDF